MADKRTPTKRDGQIRTVKGMIEKIEDMVTNDNVIEKEFTAILKNVRIKQASINALNETVIDTIEEERIEGEIQRTTDFNIQIEACVYVIESNLLKINAKERELTDNDTPSEHERRKNVVKLPKLTVKRFYGDPTNWPEFIDTFNVAIHENTELSPIEKFTYLKGYIGGEAEKSLEGLKLTSINYEHAIEILRERFGNKQLIISKHMSNLLSLDKVKNSYHVKELRSLYDKITINIRGLLSYDIDSKQFSPMLIPILMQKLPNDIKLELSKLLNKKEWNLDEIIKLLKYEIEARENCDNSAGESDNRNAVESINNRLRLGHNNPPRRITTENLLVTNNRALKSSFCKENHYSDKCTAVTDLIARREIVKNNKLCFRCLMSNHGIRNCRSKRKCFKCQSDRHHTAICDYDKELVE